MARMNNTIAEQLAGVQLSTIGNDDIKDNKAVLTERDLCSMVFENTPVKGSSIQTQKCRFSVNLRQMIDACPDISVSSNHNGILLQFPSAEVLKTVLLMKCSHYSNTVDKIRNLPQTFRFIKPHKGFIISCFTNRSLSTITSFLQDHGRIVYKSGERSCISFQEIKTAFDFMIKFRNLGPRISFESIEIISSTPWPKTPKADLPGSQSSAVSLNSPVTLVASSSTPVTESMDHERTESRLPKLMDMNIPHPRVSIKGNIQLHPISASFMHPGEKEVFSQSLRTDLDQSVPNTGLVVQTALTGLNRNEQEGFLFISHEAGIGSITGSEKFSILTEKNLCSMIFKNENNLPKHVTFSSNMCELIRRCPQVSVFTDRREEKIALCFPSPQILNSILCTLCPQESNSVEKINKLPQRFRFIQKDALFKIQCSIKNLTEVSLHLWRLNGDILQYGEPALIGFEKKKSGFLFLFKLMSLNPIIHPSCIQYLPAVQCIPSVHRVICCKYFIPSCSLSTLELK